MVEILSFSFFAIVFSVFSSLKSLFNTGSNALLLTNQDSMDQSSFSFSKVFVLNLYAAFQIKKIGIAFHGIIPVETGAYTGWWLVQRSALKE